MLEESEKDNRIPCLHLNNLVRYRKPTFSFVAAAGISVFQIILERGAVSQAMLSSVFMTEIPMFFNSCNAMS